MGLNDPPKTAVRGTPLFPHLAVALHHELRGGQLAHAHRSARVHARRGDAHLGAHAELVAVEQSRRRVDEHAGGIHLARESAKTCTTPLSCLSTGTRERSATQRTNSSPPRGMTRSRYRSCSSMAATAARSVTSTNWMAPGGAPVFSRALASTAAMRVLDSIASLPPRSSTALPDFTQRPAASAVTLGRDS